MASSHGTEENDDKNAVASSDFDINTSDYEGRTTFLNHEKPFNPRAQSAGQQAVRHWLGAMLMLALGYIMVIGAHQNMAAVLEEARAIAPNAEFAGGPLWTMDGWDEVKHLNPVRLTDGAFGKRYVLTTGRGEALVWAATAKPFGGTDWEVIAAIDALPAYNPPPPKKVNTFDGGTQVVVAPVNLAP